MSISVQTDINTELWLRLGRAITMFFECLNLKSSENIENVGSCIMEL